MNQIVRSRPLIGTSFALLPTAAGLKGGTYGPPYSQAPVNAQTLPFLADHPWLAIVPVTAATVCLCTEGEVAVTSPKDRMELNDFVRARALDSSPCGDGGRGCCFC